MTEFVCLSLEGMSGRGCTAGGYTFVIPGIAAGFAIAGDAFQPAVSDAVNLFDM